MKILTKADFASFVTAKPAAAVHFDAAWDIGHRAALSRKMEDAELALAPAVNFGEVECDQDSELAKSIPALNVPLVAYYREGKLVAWLIGVHQDVRRNLERVLRDESIS